MVDIKLEFSHEYYHNRFKKYIKEVITPMANKNKQVVENKTVVSKIVTTKPIAEKEKEKPVAVPVLKTIPDEVIKLALDSQKKYNIPASVTIAQWALESGFGTKHIGDANNYFGIKFVARRHKAGTKQNTKEEIGGKVISVNAGFAKFDNMAACFADREYILTHVTAYKRAMANIGNADEFAKCLEGSWATDSNYSEKLIKIMKDYNLYQYDTSKKQ